MSTYTFVQKYEKKKKKKKKEYPSYLLMCHLIFP